MRLFAALMMIVLLVGCAAPRGASARVVISADQYGEAFDEARDLLRECRFQPDRVDAGAGVITTFSKPTAGVATPWDLEQSSARSELSDLVNEQFRRVRVTFHPVRPELDEVEDPLGAPIEDMRLVTGDIEMVVQVFLERRRRPGRQLNPAMIELSSYTRDPDMIRRGIEPVHVQTIRRDDAFARRLAHALTRRLGMETAGE